MYNITAAVKNMFDSNYVQQIRIHMDTVGGGSYDITENSILAGTFSIDRYSVTGSRIELGTAVAGECTFKMKNYDGQWSNVSFEGAQLYVTIRIADWASNPSDSDIAVIPCGYFTIDKPVRNAKILEITALDRMAKFDKLVDTSALAVAYTPRTLIDFCCTQCGVLLANGSELADLPNANYAVSIPENIGELTYRNLLQSACMLLGTCAFIDWNGLLRIKWYETLTVKSVTGNPIVITDGAENKPVKNCTVSIEPVQSGSGTPSPTNVRPISGWTECKIIQAENVLKFRDDAPSQTTDKGITFTNVGNKAVHIKGTPTATAYSGLLGGNGEILAAGTYTFTVAGIETLPSNVFINLDDGTFHSISKANPTYTVTYASSQNITWYITVRTGQTVDALISPCYGKHNEYSIDLSTAGTVYGGTLDVTTGVLTVDRMMATFNGTYNDIFPSNTYVHTPIGASDGRFVLKVGSNYVHPTNGNNYIAMDKTVSSRFKNVAFSQVVSVSAESGTYAGQNNWDVAFVFYVSGLATKEAYEQWFADNPTELCWELKTPTTYQLTPTEITTLLGNNAITCNCGDISLSYFADDTPKNLLDFGEYFWSQTINESSGRQTDFDYSPLSKTFTINGSSTIGWNFKIGEVTLNAGTYLLTGINRNNRPVSIKLTGTGVNAIDSGEGATFTVTDSNTTLLVYLTAPEGDITYDNLEVKPSLFKTADVYPYYTSSKRYSHTIQEKDIEITGVYYAYEDEERVLHEYINGTKDYCLDISDNPFISRETVESAVQALGTALVGFSYRPLTMSVKPAPYLYPMDMFDFVTADGNIVHGIVSKITFGVNARTHIESNGQTNEDNGYATYGNFTSVQSKIIEKAKTQISRAVNERTTMLLNLNELIANSLGLYVTAVPVTGGGNQYYFHDASTLAGSNIIYTFTANGLAWTDDWNDGSPVWQYGITRDGNAIVNMLNAYKISADVITAGTMNAVNLIFGTAPNTTELRTNDTSNGALFKGQGVMDFETVGRFRAQNKLSLTGNVANEIYMWHDSSSSSIRLANKNESGSADANRIRLTATPAGAHSFQMQNYTADGVLANVFQQTVSPNVGAIQIFNYNLAQSTSSAGVLANRLAMQHSSASVNVNSLEISNMATGSANIANTITLSNNENSDFSKLSVTNNDRNGNTLRNQLELYDGSSDQYFELANFQGSTIKRGYVRGYLSGGTANVKVAANNNNNGTASEVASIEVRSDGYIYVKAGGYGAYRCGWKNTSVGWVLAQV